MYRNSVQHSISICVSYAATIPLPQLNSPVLLAPITVWDISNLWHRSLHRHYAEHLHSPSLYRPIQKFVYLTSGSHLLSYKGLIESYSNGDKQEGQLFGKCVKAQRTLAFPSAAKYFCIYFTTKAHCLLSKHLFIYTITNHMLAKIETNL